MALTKVSGPLLHGSNDNLGNYVINNITGAAATFSSVSVGGTLTYDDVTNVDSVGIVTARGGLHVGAGGTIIYALSEDNGNVGIGTTDASHQITVYAKSANSVLARFKAVNRNSNFDIFTDGSSNGQANVKNNVGATKVKLNSVGDSYFTGGDVGIGTDSPDGKLDVRGTIFVNGDATGGRIFASGGNLSLTDGNGRQTLRIDDPGSGNTHTHVFDSNGRLGIGTDNPSNALDVQGGTTNTAIVARSTDAKAQVSLVDNLTTSVGCVVLGAERDDLFLTSGSGGGQRLRIASDGKIFFGNHAGTISTTAHLGEGNTFQLAGLSSNDGISVVRFNSSFGTYGLNIGRSKSNTLGTNVALQDGNEIGHITYWGADGGDYNMAAQISAEVDGTPSNGTDMPGALTFKTSSEASGTPTERMRIQSNGIVKVESNDSSGLSAHLLVNNSESNSGLSIMGSGSSFSSGGWAAVTDAGIIRSSANSSNGLVLQAASGEMRFYVAGNPPAERLRIDGDGKVGIGTTNPGAQLHLNGATPGVRITDTDTSGPIHTNIDGASGYLTVDVGSVHRDVIITSVDQANEIVRFTGDGSVNIGGSEQTDHMLYLTSTGDASIHIRADSDNTGSENHNPSLSMSQDSSNAAQFKLGMIGLANEEFNSSIENACFIHANNHNNQPLQLAHMDNMVLTISNHESSHFHATSGISIGGLKIANRGNDTGAALLLQGHNNTGTPGQATNTQLTHDGGSLVFEIKHNGTRALHINPQNRIRLPGVPGVSGSGLVNVSIESDGNLCTQSSLRAHKINITSISDTSWLYNLNPVTFNWRTKTEVDGENVWGDTADNNGTQYGLIAEEVETVKKDFCYYNNNDELSGVHYDRMIAPLIKALQEQKTEIDSLKTKVSALEGS